jgi:hypothetical protein
MKSEFLKVKLEFLSPILGTKPDPEIFKGYLAKIAVEEHAIPKKVIDAEVDELPTDEEIGAEERGITRFPRDGEGRVFIYDYVVKGFLKNAANVLREQTGISGYKAKVTNFVFLGPRRIFLSNRSGEPILKPDEKDGRPDYKLRTKMVEIPRQGKQSVLGVSEKISNATMEIIVRIIENKGGKEGGGKVAKKEVEDLFNYGRIQGLGQWRNGGYGTFKVVESASVKMTDDEYEAYCYPNGRDMDDDIED